MTAPIVNRERLLQMLSYEPQTGIFRWRVGGRTREVGKIAGGRTDRGYWSVKLDGRDYLAHRLAWFYVTGAWPTGHIDHRNGVRDDNRFDNLREATRFVNMQNRIPAKSNRCGAFGVCESHGKFMARINIKGERVYLGTFDTLEEASERYLATKRAQHTGIEAERFDRLTSHPTQEHTHG